MQTKLDQPLKQHLHHHHHHHHSHPITEPSKQKTYREGKIRFFVLFLLAMVMFGNQYAFNNPQALQQSIMKQLDINQTQYDWLYTIFALPNIFTTFIFGFLIDFLGIRIGIMALSLGVVIFQAIVAIGGTLKSYPCMFIGRMLFGIASQSLVTAQASFVSFWFVGKQLAFSLGLAITIPQLGNALNSILTPIIYQQTQELGPPLFTSVGICIFGFLCAVSAAYIDKLADEQDYLNNIKIIETETKDNQSEQLKCQDLKLLKGSFWLIVILCMFAVALYVCFLDNANKLIQVRFCFTQVSAGRAIMITYIIVTCCSAPLGILVDRIGFKRYFIITGMVIFTIAHLIILIYPQCIDGQVNPGASWGFFLLGIGYCFYANCIVPSIPLVVRKKIMGSAFGIMQMIQSIALSIYPLIVGQLVSHAKHEQLGYRHSSLFFLVIGLLGILSSLGLLFISEKTKKKLDGSSRDHLLKKVHYHQEPTSQSQYFWEKKISNNGDVGNQELGKQLLGEDREGKVLVDADVERKLRMQL